MFPLTLTRLISSGVMALQSGAFSMIWLILSLFHKLCPSRFSIRAPSLCLRLGKCTYICHLFVTTDGMREGPIPLLSPSTSLLYHWYLTNRKSFIKETDHRGNIMEETPPLLLSSSSSDVCRWGSWGWGQSQKDFPGKTFYSVLFHIFLSGFNV